MAQLTLTVSKMISPLKWTWVLRNFATGVPLSDFEVSLEAERVKLARFLELQSFVREQSDILDPKQSEQAVLLEVGLWLTENLLGMEICAKIKALRPGIVVVEVPDVLGFVTMLPLELATSGGSPLYKQNVQFVYRTEPAPRVQDGAPASDQDLRILAVFSAPADLQALNLRRERVALVNSIRESQVRHGNAIDLRILHYGATKELLANAILDGAGWDVIHISGHGAQHIVVLEDGSADGQSITADELIELVRASSGASNRLKLAVLSTCNSAASDLRQTIDMLRCESSEEGSEPSSASATHPGGEAASLLSFGRRLASETGATVIAMRYEVGDDFAIDFGAALYTRLFDSKQPITDAVRLAVASACAVDLQGSNTLTLSAVTPVIFSSDASSVRIVPPRHRSAVEYTSPFAKLSWFPDEAEVFVGRAAEMAKALTVMRPDSGIAAIQFVGLAGVGKTALTVELAYRVADEFEVMVFWSAREFSADPFLALASLASSLDRQLAALGIAFSPHFTSADELAAFLPMFRQLLKLRGILFCLDGLEVLVSSSGRLRDDRWIGLLEVLCNHPGYSRTLITTSVPLVEIPKDTIQRISSLSAAESILLSRSLPNLQRLLQAARADWLKGDKEAAALYQQVLSFTQGHPMMMRFIDSVAGRGLEQVIELLRQGAPVGSTGPRGAEPNAADAQVVETLQSATLKALSEAGSDARLLANLIAVLQPADRTMPVISFVWNCLHEEPLTALAKSEQINGDSTRMQVQFLTAVAELESSLVIELQVSIKSPQRSSPEMVSLMPVVQLTIRSGVNPALFSRVATLMVEYWQHRLTRSQEAGPSDDIRILSGLAAAPYLLSLGRFSEAGAMIERATVRDRSPQVLSYALPLLKRVRDETQADFDIACYAETLYDVDPVAGRDEMFRGLAVAEAQSNHRLCAILLESLANDDAGRGEWDDARSRLTQSRRERQLASPTLDRLTALRFQITEIRILSMQEEVPSVLAQHAVTLRALLTELRTGSRSGNEFVEYWMVEEYLARTGRTLAVQLSDWDMALDYSNLLNASLRKRGAVEHTQAIEAVPSYYPLACKFEIEEARRLLIDCQRIFTEKGDFEHLGFVYGARATVAKMDDDPAEALRWQKRALKLKYRNLDVVGCAISHQNFANLCDEPQQLLAHRLAGCLLELKAKGVLTLKSASILGRNIADGLLDSNPLEYGDLAALVAEIEGVNLGIFLPDDAEGAHLLSRAVSQASAVDPALLYRDFLVPFQPFLLGVAALANGDESVRAEVVSTVRAIASKDAVSADLLQRIVAGARGKNLLDGLAPRQRVLIAEVLKHVR